MLCWVTLTSFTTACYYYRYNDLLGRVQGRVITVNIGILYGNGTIVWYDAPGLIGMNLFDLTSRLANLTYIGIYGYGVLITSISGVENSDLYHWILYSWNSTQGYFEPTSAAPDQHIVTNGERFLWFCRNTTTVDNVAKELDAS